MEWGGFTGVGRALVINRYARHSEKLTEIYDVQIYGSKQKGRGIKTGKEVIHGGKREETERWVYYTNEEKGASDQ